MRSAPSIPRRPPAIAPALALALAALLAGCGGGLAGPGDPREPAISPDALSYLATALDTMQRLSVNRYRIDWPTFRADVIRKAGAAQTYRETYPAIRYAVEGLGDRHSYFREPEEAPASLAAAQDPAPGARADRVRERLGYLRVPGYLGSPGTDFGQRLQDLVREVDTAAPTCGWIVDLRANRGGNMWAMLMGVGPLAGSGVVGYFVDPDSVWSAWSYHPETGEVRQNGQSGARVPAPYLLARDPPVAVLTRNTTVSAGEAIATAFRGRPETRSFGEGTGGLSTAIRGIGFRDGAGIGLAVSVFADRNRTPYGGTIPVDQPVAGVMRDDPNDADAVVEAAADWLLSREACR